MACPVAYTIPRRELFEKKQRLYRKAKHLQTHGKKIQERNKEKAFKTYDDYVSNLLGSMTNPDLPMHGI